jgi:hypothetical protein
MGYGLLITPTCDMAEQHDRGGGTPHPFRTLVPVLPLKLVVEQTAALEQTVNLLRSRDTVHPYMYLLPLPGILEEDSVACLFRPSLCLMICSLTRRDVSRSCNPRRDDTSRSSWPPTGAAWPLIRASFPSPSGMMRTHAQTDGHRACTTTRKVLWSRSRCVRTQRARVGRACPPRDSRSAGWRG